MPSHVTGGRFTVRHYHHPQIVAELHELSPHLRVWDLIVRARVVFHFHDPGDASHPASWAPREEWRGSASDLERLLTGPTSALTIDEKREIPKPNWLGQRLASIQEHFGEKVCRLEASRLKKTWVMHPRPEDMEGTK